MSDIEYAVKATKRIEDLLKKSGAHGRGLHEKLSSIENKLPADIVKKGRFIATIRNKIVHEQSYKKIDDKKAFKRACKDIEKRLSKSNKPLFMLFLIVLIIILIIVVLIFGEQII